MSGQGQNIIEVGFNIDKLTQEKKQVYDIVIDLFATLEKYDGFKFDPTKGGGLTQLRTSIQETGKAMQDYQQLAQKYNETVQNQGAASASAKKANDELMSSEKQHSAVIYAQTTSYDQLIKKSVEYQRTQKDLAQTAKDLEKAYQAGEISLDEFQTKMEAVKAAQVILKVSTAEVTRSLSLLEKQSQSASDSQAQLESRLDQLKIAYSKLSGAERDSNAGQTLLKEIQETDAAVKNINYSVGQFQRNVGNYSGSFVKAFEVLKDQLAVVKGEMGDVEAKGVATVNKLTGGNPIGFDPNRFKGDVTNFVKTGGGSVNIAAGDAATYQELTNKAQLLETNIERLSIGFKTTRQESRAFAEAASQVGLTLGLDSEEFQEFDKAVGHTQKSINDIKEATKFQSSDAKVIKGLAEGASTLAGAFGAAQAAESLFAGDDQDLQKQMAKFQQLLVLINGLQAVANGLQAESGGMQLLLSARTNLLNAAKTVQLLLTTKAIQALEAEAIATEAAAVTKEQDAVATTELAVAETAQTVAVTANTEATVANAAAQGGAKAATGGLSTAFIAGGIATLAIGAGVALALLTAKLIGYGDQALLTVDQQKDLASVLKEINDTLEAQAKIFDTLDSGAKRYYSDLIAGAQAAGASQYAVLLLQQKADKAQAEAAKAEIDRLGATDAAYSRQANTVQRLQNDIIAAAEIRQKLDAIPEKDQTSDQKRQLQAAKDNGDIFKAQLANAQGTFDKMTKAREDFATFTKKADLDETQFNKLSLDDQLDVVEKSDERRAGLVKERNAIILSSEKSTLHDRITAIESNLAQENAILDAQAAKIKGNPANFINGFLTPQAQAQLDQLGAQRVQNTIKTNDEILKQNREFYKRQRDATLDAYKSQQEDQIKAAQDIQQGKVNNPNPLQPNKVPLSDQLTALASEAQARRNIINAQRQRDLDDIGINGKESGKLFLDREADISKINAKFQSDLLEVNRNFTDARQSLEIKALEQSKKEWEQYYQERKNQIDTNETDEIVLLNEASEKKLINERRYARQRQKIEDDAALDRARLALRDAEITRNSTKDGTAERAKAEGDLTAARKGFSDQVKKNDDDATKARKDQILDTLHEVQEVGGNVEDALSDVQDISLKNQKNRLTERENEQQRSYEEDQTRISTSSEAESTKAAQLMLLDKQRQQQKEINDRKNRQLDNEKAAFDKAAAVANIILKTTVAVVSALPDIPLAISVGILGAAELAEAVAVQPPKYRLGAGIAGRPNHPGGAAWVGDNWQKELISEPGESPFWSPASPTLMDLKPHTQVIPLDMISQMMMDGHFANYGAIFGGRPDDGIAQQIGGLRDTMIWQTTIMKEAFRQNNKSVHVHNHIGKEAAHAAWVAKNIFN